MQGAPAWAEPFIGIPYAKAGRDPAVGLDCWGLLAHVLKARANIEIPAYEGIGWTDRHASAALADLMARQRAADGWEAVWEKARPNDALPPDAALEPLDGLLLRMDGVPIHVGVMVGNGYFLHTEKEHDSAADELFGLRWKYRVIGVYRWKGQRG